MDFNVIYSEVRTLCLYKRTTYHKLKIKAIKMYVAIAIKCTTLILT